MIYFYYSCCTKGGAFLTVGAYTSMVFSTGIETPGIANTLTALGFWMGFAMVSVIACSSLLLRNADITCQLQVFVNAGLALLGNIVRSERAFLC